MIELTKNRGGRPPSANPRTIRHEVKLTPDEYIAARDAAAAEGTSVSELLRRAIPRASHVTLVSPIAGIQRSA